MKNVYAKCPIQENGWENERIRERKNKRRKRRLVDFSFFVFSLTFFRHLSRENRKKSQKKRKKRKWCICMIYFWIKKYVHTPSTCISNEKVINKYIFLFSSNFKYCLISFFLYFHKHFERSSILSSNLYVECMLEYRI